MKNSMNMKKRSTDRHLLAALAAALMVVGFGGGLHAQEVDHTGPKVGGAVFGGGRMANVTGTTSVTVHNTDSLGAVYGGNDISGNCGAATITIGTSFTSVNAIGAEGNTLASGIKIGSVYGGGNGYYKYSSSSTEGDDLPSEATSSTVSGAPQLPSTKITVVEDAVAKNLVQIDELFGGAKAAYLTGTGTAVDIAINGGTIISAFGGNNYGGSIAGDITIAVTSTDMTKETENDAQTMAYKDLTNSATSGFGRDFGIRYLFGGGNKVVHEHGVTMNITGGMIDTCFAGGNSATVSSTSVTVNAEGTNSIFKNSSTNDNSADYGDYTALSHEGGNGKYGVDQWVGGKGTYNIHTLFGGNNQAAMAIVPTLTLTSGGIGTIYGGGNAGRMTGSETYEGVVTSTKVLLEGTGIKTDYVYGGCQMADVENSTYVALKGSIVGTVFGGNNISGNVGRGTAGCGTNVVISGGSTIYGNVFGGSNGYYHCNDYTNYIDGTHFHDNDNELFDPEYAYIGMAIPTQNRSNVNISAGNVYGNVYAAGNLANVGFSSSYSGTYYTTANSGEVNLTITDGTVKGTVYGGGNMASVFGLTNLNIEGGNIGNIYAGNDKTGVVESFVAYSSDYASDGVTPINTQHTNAAGDVIATDAIYSTYLHITGNPVIDTIFGGGNGDYDYESNDRIEHCLACDGISKPIQKSTLVDINMTAGNIDVVVGGGNGVTVEQNVTILLNNADTTNSKVGTIFGGNNRAWMYNIVPNILLTKGSVDTVYGGGNAGHMLGVDRSLTDICGNQLSPVSTYVLMNSDNVNVNTIYGGCKMADLVGIAYVDVRKGRVQTVYGGNNISGSISEARVDLYGGVVDTLFGGSNGKYYYEDGNAFRYADHDTLVAESNTDLGITVASPYVGYANVNIYGGTVNNSVYGGGNFGDCGDTKVVINDAICSDSRVAEDSKGNEYPTTFAATVKGTVFGGGAGNYESLCEKHVGNVKKGVERPAPSHNNGANLTEVEYVGVAPEVSEGKSVVELHHARTITDASAYGGGKGGDVESSTITVFDTWEQKLDALYGGCWGSNVNGTATTLVDADLEITEVYGGNDVSGNVKAVNLTINKGKFVNIYGAGNGAYSYPESGADTVPNAEDVTINIAENNSIEVSDNLYGGGRMGTVFKTTGEVSASCASTFMPDTACNASAVSRIELNIHGGQFKKDIYAGGDGAEGGKQISYAVKQVNMDGGNVAQSLYGGTHNVDDGFGHSCGDTWANTMPSSILNLTGGTYGANVYGGGYLGKTYGSNYVNIGADAVRNSGVWTRGFRRGYSVAEYKPTVTSEAPEGNQSGTTQARDLKAANIALMASVYSGANWGEASGEADFEATEGFIGGTSQILIDANGYQEQGQPTLNIAKSVIGAGTSTRGGDLSSAIVIKNYGKVNGCNGANQMLESVQRTDSLTLENTAIVYTGGADASSAYSAINYSINRVNAVMIGKGYNNVTIQKPIDNVAKLVLVDASGNVISSPMTIEGEHCGTCEEYSYNTENTLFYVQNGSYVRVMLNDTYGSVEGWAYVVTDEGFKAQLMAATTTGTAGGYVSPCYESNTHSDPLQIGWTDLTSDLAYRLWTVGTGTSAVAQQIDAFSNPSEHSDINRLMVTTNCASSDPNASATSNMSLAKATLFLPATTETGHYYKLQSGVIVAESKGMALTGAAWYPTVPFADLSDVEWANDAEDGDDGSVKKLLTPWAQGQGGCYDASEIKKNPDNNFGMVLVPGTGFDTPADENITALSANSNFSTEHAYTTPAVNAVGMPQIDVYLTYDNDFAKTIVGDVTFKLTEYDANGVEVGTVDVTLTVNTIRSNIKGQYVDVLAMYNEGTSNVYVRRRVFPAMLSSRDVYLSSVRWEPVGTEATLAGAGTNARGDRTTVDENQSRLDGVTTHEDNKNFFLTSGTGYAGTNNHFTLTARPTEDLTSNVTTITGWYTKEGAVDVYDVTKNNAHCGLTLGTFSETSKHTGTAHSEENDTVLFSKWPAHGVVGTDGKWEYESDWTDANFNMKVESEKGIKIGTLDGRAAASIDYELGFDGSQLFPKGFVGRIILDYATYKKEAFQGRFYDTIYVRCRTAGDTIFLASAETVERCGITLSADVARHLNDSESNRKTKGKSPQKYLQSFEDAFNDELVYIEGDVFAIIDQYDITTNTALRGLDMTRVPVIRYAGHHHQLPGDCGAYHGTMFDIKNGARFSALNVTFDGSSIAKRKEDATAAEKHNDTTKANGPIFLVEGASTLALSAGTVVRNNYNVSTENPGAIRLVGSNTAASTLTLDNGVTIENNLNTKSGFVDAEDPVRGAVQVEKGSVVLGTSKEGALVADKNYLLEDGTQYWADNAGKRTISIPEGSTLANVYLGRTEKTTELCSGTTTTELEDTYNSRITFSSALPTGSHIGISKLFPGKDVRDTISVVYANTVMTDYINAALGSENSGTLFVDNNAREMQYYGSADERFNGRYFYFHRCASFRNQLADQYCESPVLEYSAAEGAGCGSVGESLKYSFRGGFAPYTLTWTKDNVAEAPITISEKPENALMDATYDIAADEMTPGHTGNVVINLMAAAKDDMGCETSKSITITYSRSEEESGVTEGEGEASLTDTVPEHIATLDRHFQAMKITANVWPEATDGSVKAVAEGETLDLTQALFCEGEVVALTATPADGKNFIMWDIDPYDNADLTYVVNNVNNEMTAYFGPAAYWHEHINSLTAANASYDGNYYADENTANYVTTYNGDVHIYNEDGLAWLISVVNGLNGTQSREFYFNKVYLHDKEGGYDMKDYLWTPMGRQQHPFRGRLIGVSSERGSVAPLTDSRVAVKNIIVNEPSLNYVGFFAFLDTAQITGVELQNSLFHGAQYVGAMAAKAVNDSRIDNCAVGSDEEADATIITTHYTSGGMIGWAENSKVDNSTIKAKYMGDAVYTGGIFGRATASTQASNTAARNDVRMEAVYMGGLAGEMNGTTSVPMASMAKSTSGARLSNNFVYNVTDGRNQNMGGLVGRANNAILENNYVYGNVEGTVKFGGIAAELNEAANATNNYVEAEASNQMAGRLSSTATLYASTTFAGQGNQVIVAQPVYGVDNLTRILNFWVREHNADGGNYLTWRSDLAGVNNGYPVFGTPDMIPVTDSAELLVCDSIEIDGILYTDNAVVMTSTVDSVMMIDSITTLTLTVHHSVAENYSDSVVIGQGYEGYGFSLDASEGELLRRTVETYGSASLVLVDSLTTEYGCDSIITLTLTFVKNNDIVEVGATNIKVYPNPTTASVKVEADQLRFVELYDNDGRRMMRTQQVENGQSVELNVSSYATGVYYVRVHTANGVTIQKLIKK